MLGSKHGVKYYRHSLIFKRATQVSGSIVSRVKIPLKNTPLTLQHKHVSRPIERLVRPFQEFANRESSGGILLLLSTLAARAWANSLWSKSYFELWHIPLTIGFGNFILRRDLLFLVNDGLMAFFFFVVGLEIKRELLVGELASPRQAALPILAAIGGVVFPALIYSAVNLGGPGAPGW